jgi:hypothetical protein
MKMKKKKRRERRKKEKKRKKRKKERREKKSEKRKKERKERRKLTERQGLTRGKSTRLAGSETARAALSNRECVFGSTFWCAEKGFSKCNCVQMAFDAGHKYICFPSPRVQTTDENAK